MLNRRFHLHELFAALLALMVQLGSGAIVPRTDPVTNTAALCHTEQDTGGTPSQAPVHPADCLVCPVCGLLHARVAALVPVGMSLIPPGTGVVFRAELPPPSTAPPALFRPVSQPRAPPAFS